MEQENKKQLAGFLAIGISEDAINKAGEFVRERKDWPGGISEVAITYRGEKVEMSMREFLEAMGFENIPCATCDGEGEVEGTEYECNDSTGYNTVAMGNGKMEPCEDCNGTGVQAL